MTLVGEETYPSAEVSSVYPTAPADWAIEFGIEKFATLLIKSRKRETIEETQLLNQEWLSSPGKKKL